MLRLVPKSGRVVNINFDVLVCTGLEVNTVVFDIDNDLGFPEDVMQVILGVAEFELGRLLHQSLVQEKLGGGVG